jgi:ankyrin repeat protein
MSSKVLASICYPLRPLLNKMLLGAVRRSDLSAARKAIALGASCDALDRDGFTPLTINHTMDDSSCCAMARILIEAGASLNLPNASGMRALHYAALFCLVDLSCLLLEAGADPEAPNAEGLSPARHLRSFHLAAPQHFNSDLVARIEALYERQALVAAAGQAQPHSTRRASRI